MEKFKEWDSHYIGCELNFMSDDDDVIFVIQDKKIIYKGSCENLKINRTDLLKKRIKEWDVRFSRKVRKKLIVAVI